MKVIVVDVIKYGVMTHEDCERIQNNMIETEKKELDLYMTRLVKKQKK